MKSFRNVIGVIFLLVLPVGYYHNSNDSTHVTVSAEAGWGNYAKLIQGCEGEQSVSMVSFRDIGGSVAVHPTRHSPFVLGFRGGYLSVEELPPRRDENYSRYVSANTSYINPHFSLEFKPFGLGAGWVRNLGRVYDRGTYYVQDIDFRRLKDFPSGHLRIGTTSSWYLLASYCEGLPVMTQYGTVLGAIGYGGNAAGQFMGGVCGGLYDHAGLFVGARTEIPSLGMITSTIRIGRNYDTFEGSFSAGWETSFW